MKPTKEAKEKQTARPEAIREAKQKPNARTFGKAPFWMLVLTHRQMDTARRPEPFA